MISVCCTPPNCQDPMMHPDTECCNPGTNAVSTAGSGMPGCGGNPGGGGNGGGGGGAQRLSSMKPLSPLARGAPEGLAGEEVRAVQVSRVRMARASPARTVAAAARARAPAAPLAAEHLQPAAAEAPRGAPAEVEGRAAAVQGEIRTGTTSPSSATQGRLR
jgi:hypothetical protein